eukprot:SAG11_NODE_5711_length_1481_cov_1.559334_3_plen_113_part_00
MVQAYVLPYLIWLQVGVHGPGERQPQKLTGTVVGKALPSPIIPFDAQAERSTPEGAGTAAWASAFCTITIAHAQTRVLRVTITALIESHGQFHGMHEFEILALGVFMASKLN